MLSDELVWHSEQLLMVSIVMITLIRCHSGTSKQYSSTLSLLPQLGHWGANGGNACFQKFLTSIFIGNQLLNNSHLLYCLINLSSYILAYISIMHPLNFFSSPNWSKQTPTALDHNPYPTHKKFQSLYKI